VIGSPTPRLRAYVTAGFVGLIAALAVGTPEPALIGAVLLSLAMIGLAGSVAPAARVQALSVPLSAVEGEPFDFVIRVDVEQPVGRSLLEVELGGLQMVGVAGARQTGPSTISLNRIEQSADVVVTVEPTGWGRSLIGPITFCPGSALGMVDLELVDESLRRIVTLPREMTVRRLLAPIETSLHVGDLVSTRRGSGSEFADMRPFRPGDDPRSLNWRVSSRFQSLWVNDRHPERNGDVVLLVDAQVESGTELQALVDRSIRLAAALLQGYSRHHHRLGLVTLDGVCRWMTSGMGELHRRRLLEQLLAVAPGQVVWEAAEQAVARVARRPAMVVALTPLMDPNMAGLIHTLRRSGLDVRVVGLDVEGALVEPEDEARALARRIWVMERQRLRDRLAGEGVPFAVWKAGDPPDVPLAQIESWKAAWRRLG
jgi:uncharacterized protein (DUF58 family)